MTEEKEPIKSTEPTLDKIREELKVPKQKHNSFGKYDYRSLSDILEHLKPLLRKHGTFLELKDSVELIGERYYVKAEAVLSDSQGDYVTATGFAREQDEKKGMSADQVTGSASSYARKYALNALFLIDDSAEPDEAEDHSITMEEAEEIKTLLESTDSDVAAFLEWADAKSVEEMSAAKLTQARKMLEKKGKK